MSFFGKNLKFLRLRQEQSQAEFARAIDVWENTLDRYERGKAEPDLDTLIQIAECLKIPIDHLLSRDLGLVQARVKARKAKLILLDIDGTMTDGRVGYTQSGDQIKTFHTKDGLLIQRLTRQDIQFGFISSASTDYLIQKRAETLGIQRVYAGSRNKMEVVEEWLKELSLRFEQLAYVGDDVNDLAVIRKAGISACPADATAMVKQAVQVILTRNGGDACIREFLEETLGYHVG
ncbi:MAG: helix-turn-helix domain-containing protein [Bacteroidota bacterium]